MDPLIHLWNTHLENKNVHSGTATVLLTVLPKRIIKPIINLSWGSHEVTNNNKMPAVKNQNVELTLNSKSAVKITKHRSSMDSVKPHGNSFRACPLRGSEDCLNQTNNLDIHLKCSILYFKVSWKKLLQFHNFGLICKR